jgi:membrane fusion protein, copper/silver efflux system
VGVGQRFFELADNSQLRVEARVCPNELQMLKPGMAADVFIQGANDWWIPNRIDFINPAFEPGTNITIVGAIIDNPGKRLRPGMLALLNINTDQKKGS